MGRGGFMEIPANKCGILLAVFLTGFMGTALVSKRSLPGESLSFFR
jgi:hypothetical protein